MKAKKNFKIILPIGIILLMILCLSYILRPTDYVVNERPRTDFIRLEQEDYDTVFLSMFPIQHYKEEDYAYYWAKDTLKAEVTIPNTKIYDAYVNAAFPPEHTVTGAYLGIRPEQLPLSKITALLERETETTFDILFPYPQLSYWNALDEEYCRELLECYELYAAALLPYENARLYLFAGVEWLVGNPGNYDHLFRTNEDISRTLMCNTDDFHGYMLTPDNLEASFENLRQMIIASGEQVTIYPDASDWDVVFLGDSFFANYTDSASIPGVVRGFTGATVFNCGLGGQSAAFHTQTNISFPDIVRAFTSGTTEGLPTDSPLFQNAGSFLDREPEKHLMFVINYGLNDYFRGMAVSTDDSYDETSYKGALRKGITDLQKAYPDAEIILNTPTFTVYYENGTELRSDVGGQLIDYVEAVRELGEELNITVLDTYQLLPTTAENWTGFLTDGCHPNESTRFLLGSLLAELMPAN